jgi:nicotinamidase-related amidase
LFAEKLELLLKIRDNAFVHWSGKFRPALTGQGVYPRPVQNPLPIWLGVGGQSGLFQTVKDMEMTVLRANVVTLAKIATLAKIPVITTASVPQGPNGPPIPEIHKYARHAKYVARHGQINAWDNPDFVKAVEDTKRKTLIIAGTITSVCLTEPSLCAISEGYKVLAVVDASGTYSKMAQEISLTRLAQAGVFRYFR